MRPKDTRTREEKFHQSYTITSGGCWEFNKLHKSTGYGRFYYDYKSDRAHRVSWEIHHGPIKGGQLVRHKCDNPPCVNPEHLELGTEADNARDAVERRRTLVGERNQFAKLTDEDVRAIRASSLPKKDIALHYDITIRTVRDIVNRKTWKHL